MGDQWLPVSVIVRTFNEARWIADTLDALLAQDYPAEVEVLVVDTGSTDGTLDIVRQSFTRVWHYRQPYTPGGALNVGARATQYPLIVNLSADAKPASTAYLRALVHPLLEDANVAATFGRDLPRPGALPSQARDLATWFPASSTLDAAQRFSNANACVRRSVWERHPFDENIKSTEDLLWARQVLADGYCIVYAPEATTFHTHSPACREVFIRAKRQRIALSTLAPSESRFSLWRALRFWGGLSLLDVHFAIKHRYPPRKWFYSWVFRACQAWGVYQGALSARRMAEERDQ